MAKKEERLLKPGKSPPTLKWNHNLWVTYHLFKLQCPHRHLFYHCSFSRPSHLSTSLDKPEYAKQNILENVKLNFDRPTSENKSKRYFLGGGGAKHQTDSHDSRWWVIPYTSGSPQRFLGRGHSKCERTLAEPESFQEKNFLMWRRSFEIVFQQF